MRLKAIVLAIALSTISLGFANADSNDRARKAASFDPNESAKAIAALRAEGQTGVQAFLAAYSDEMSSSVSEERKRQINAALDQVCAQRDCRASQLFWHTDLDRALEESRATRRPVLSLRLLGRLDQEFSCANSRLFRITLYANKELSHFLRNNYVLHWKSVRPAPKVTIDFGDGRRIERTLTGNSIHYVLDSRGSIIDALPGLYGPQAFLRELKRASEFARSYALHSDQSRAAFLRDYHLTRMREIRSRTTGDFAKLGLSAPALPARPSTAAPSAETASLRAYTKMVVVERPLLRRISSDPSLLDPTNEDKNWSLVANLHQTDAKLDDDTISLIRSKNVDLYGPATDAARSALAGTVALLERSIAEDTVRNEYLFRSRILEWLAYGIAADGVEKFNEKVYAELFLTPSSDPWLGLLSPDSYTGIESEGVKK